MVMNFCERKWGEDFIENICQQPCNFLVPLPSLFSCAKSSSVFLCGTTLYLGKGIIKYEEASQTSSGKRLDLLHKSCEIMAHYCPLVTSPSIKYKADVHEEKIVQFEDKKYEDCLNCAFLFPLSFCFVYLIRLIFCLES